MSDEQVCAQWLQNDGHSLRQILMSVQGRLGGADKGYRGHGIKVGEQAMPRIFLSGQKQGVTNKIKQALRRRSAVEPVIGHMKENGCF